MDPVSLEDLLGAKKMEQEELSKPVLPLFSVQTIDERPDHSSAEIPFGGGSSTDGDPKARGAGENAPNSTQGTSE